MIDTKLKKILFILEEFHKRQDHVLDAYDEELSREFKRSPKSIGKLLEEIEREVDNVEEIKVGKKKAWKLMKPMDLFVETFKNSHEIHCLMHMAHDADPEIFKELEKYTNENEHMYQFKNTPFEDMQTLEDKETFKRLRTAVEHREYRKIKFKGNSDPQDNLKCLKLIFMDSNWYIAYVNRENELRFGRINFIERVEYATNIGSFQPSTVKKQMNFLKNIQNSMTLYDKPKTIAKIKARPFIARYFDEGMKPFLSSQKFEKKLDDGSIIFTAEYTQPMEILPLIQGWLPNLIILEPKELKDKYLERLNYTINNHN